MRSGDCFEDKGVDEGILIKFILRRGSVKE
jgi:hypothetical protein